MHNSSKTKLRIAFCLILISLILPAAHVVAQTSEPTLESNVDFFLSAEGLREAVKLQGPTSKGNSIAAIPSTFNGDGTPTLLSQMEARPLDWRETKGPLNFFDMLCHYGRWKSFRSTMRPSLHVIVFRKLSEDGQYRYWFLIHFDKYVPSGSHLWETTKHMTLEFIPNTFLGTSTSQHYVKDALDKRYHSK
jgi:hypothetical protein